MRCRHHEDAGTAIGDVHVSVGIKREACRCIECTWGDSGSAGCNGNLGCACPVEPNLQDLIKVSVTYIEIGAGVVDSERLREAYAVGAQIDHGGLVRRVEGFPGNHDDFRGVTSVGNVEVARKVNFGGSGHSHRKRCSAHGLSYE